MKRTLFFLIAALLLPISVAAQVPISGLPAASLPLTGAETVPLVQSGVTRRATLNEVQATVVTSVYTAERFGAKCDGSTNDSVAFQTGLNYISAHAIAPVSGLAPTTVLLVSPGKSCVIGDVTVPSYTGIGSIGAGVGTLPAPKLVQLAGSTYILKNTSAVVGVSISNLAFQGTGSATTSIGVYFPLASRSVFSNNQFNNFGSSALVVATTSGVANSIRSNLAENSVLNHGALAAKTGVLTIGGTDNYVDSNEATCSLSALTSSNLYCVAIYFPSGAGAFGNNFVTNNVGEISDVGIEDDANTDRLVGNRGDLNYGPGFLIGGSEQLVNNLAINNSQSASGAYSGFLVTGGTGLFENNLAYTQVANAHKYGFEDSIASDTTKNFYGPTNRSFGQTLSTYKLAGFAGSAVATPHGQAKTFPANATTPSVDNYYAFKTNNSAPTVITNLTLGFPGQEVLIFIEDANTSIGNGGGITTPTGGTVAFTNGQSVILTNNNGTWKFTSNNP